MSGDGDLVNLRSSKLPIIWVLGGPGSGKGTQCARLVSRYGFLHLSSGDLLRDEVASGSAKGKELNEIMSKGMLVPRDVVLDLIKEAMLKNLNTAKGFLIDGYPREVEQGIDFEHKIAPCSLILYYDCSDATMTKRLLERGISSGRVDDNEETIKKRLETFHQHSEPVMKHYSTKVAHIDANTDPDTIFGISVQNVDKILVAAGIALPQ
jgi:adenylate kinase